MPKRIVMEQFHLTVLAPVDLRTAEYKAMRRTLTRKRFHASLRGAARELFQRYPSLRNTHVSLDR
jgi:hypothetical protein